MERKTIGSFIATLRKANGMTQKELAERLNVSDKTVSRWERDDGAPDLSAIPVIAEIFGVTCDELLRGERRAATEQIAEHSAKGEKERQRLMKASLSQYRNCSYIAIGISVIGMIAALIGNLAFLRAVLGFLLGAVFFAASVVCQLVFCNRAMQTVDEESAEGTALASYKWSVVRLTEESLGVTTAFVGFTCPLMLVDAYMGLGADSLLLFGAIGAVILLLLYLIGCYYYNGRLLNNPAYTMAEKQDAAYRHNHRLLGKCGRLSALGLAFTLVFQLFGTEMLWSVHNLTPQQVFEDYDSFIEYMAQPLAKDDNRYAVSLAGPLSVFGSDGYQDSTVSMQEPYGKTYYYDEEGNEITEREARTHTLMDKNGKVVCTYVQWNEQVASVSWEAGEGTVLPITVVTDGAYRMGANRAQLVNAAYCVLYPLELLVVGLAYRKKRVQL